MGTVTALVATLAADAAQRARVGGNLRFARRCGAVKAVAVQRKARTPDPGEQLVARLREENRTLRAALREADGALTKAADDADRALCDGRPPPGEGARPQQPSTARAATARASTSDSDAAAAARRARRPRNRRRTRRDLLSRGAVSPQARPHGPPERAAALRLGLGRARPALAPPATAATATVIEPPRHPVDAVTDNVASMADYAIEQMQLPRQRRVDGAGRPKFDFHTRRRRRARSARLADYAEVEMGGDVREPAVLHAAPWTAARSRSCGRGPAPHAPVRRRERGGVDSAPGRLARGAPGPTWPRPRRTMRRQGRWPPKGSMDTTGTVGFFRFCTGIAPVPG